MEILPVTEEDAQALLSIYAPYVRDTAVSFEYEVPSVADFQDRIRRISSDYPYIKAVENGEILGYAYAGSFKSRRAYDWSVEVTVYVRQDSRRAGIGRRLYQVLEASLRRMGVLNMNACIAMPRGADAHLNDDSCRFHEKMGFVPVGTFHNSGYKFQTWYDMIWMEKLIGQHQTQQEDVRFGTWTVK